MRGIVSNFGPQSGTVAARHYNVDTPRVALSVGMRLASSGDHHSVQEVGHNGNAEAWQAQPSGGA